MTVAPTTPQPRKGRALRAPRLGLGLTVLAMVAFLALFVVVPVSYLLVESIVRNGALDFTSFERILTRPFNHQIIMNTITLGTTVAVLVTVLGFVLAYAVSHVHMRFARVYQLFILLPIVAPPFVLALAAVLLLGRNGLITRTMLGLETSALYGLPGIVLGQTFALLPIAYLVLLGTLQAIDPSMEENARNLGASRFDVFRTVTLPLATPGIAASLLLVFVQSIADIGNPIVIGGDFHVLASRVYFQLIGAYDARSGATLAVILLLPSILAFLMQKYWVERRSYVSVTGKAARARIRTRSRGQVLAANVLCTTVCTIIAVFYGMIFLGALSRLWGIDYTLTFVNYQRIFVGLGTKAITDTLQLAAVATPISGIVGIVIAYLLTRVRFRGQGFVEFLALLSLAVPGVVLGVGYAIFFNRPPFYLTGTSLIIIMAFVVSAVPVGIRAGMAGLRQIDPALEEASANLGASRAQTVLRIVLPLLRPAFFAGLLYSFVRSMTLVSAVIFLVSAKWRLITVSMLNAVELGQLGVAAAFATLLIVITLIVMLAMQLVLRRIGRSPADLAI